MSLGGSGFGLLYGADFVCMLVVVGYIALPLTGLVEEEEEVVVGVPKCGFYVQCGELGDGRRESVVVVFKGQMKGG